MIKLIWAMDKNNLIGKDNKIPWHYKEDLQYYKSKTEGNTVIMGDNTYYSLKGYYKTRPLPYGKIYVATLKDLVLEDAEVIHDINAFLTNFPKDEELWVCGGMTIYKFAMPYADELYVTIVDKEHEGDAYFPQIDFNTFELKSSRRSTESPELDFRVYGRK